MKQVVDPEVSGGGNTKLPPRNKKRLGLALNWTFTFWIPDEKDTSLRSLWINFEDILFSKACDYYYGVEIGPECGRLHYQGFCEFKKKVRANEFVGIPQIHWESRRGSREENILYCAKDGKVITNTKWKPPRPLIDPMMGKILKQWQFEILEMIKEPCNDSRKIYWYWSKEGCIGKTCFVKHICMHNNTLFLSGSAKDIKCGIAKMGENGTFPDICIFGYPRDVEDHVSYAALEEVKDGIFYSGKYESSMCVFNTPHVIVIANFKPKMEKLSKDRWIIQNIDE